MSNFNKTIEKLNNDIKKVKSLEHQAYLFALRKLLIALNN